MTVCSWPRGISAAVVVLAFVGAAWVSTELRGTSKDAYAAHKRQQPSRSDNPNYPTRNPFYFEGKVDYELLGIDEPSNTWEFLQRGIHFQDGLEDYESAKADYRRSLELNNVRNGTCRIIRSRDDLEIRDPAPCMFTPRLRLGYLLLHEDPEESIRLFEEVLDIDPLRLEVNLLIGEAYEVIAEAANDPVEKRRAYEAAINSFHAELALTPLGAPSITPDKAHNAKVHWLLGDVYERLDRSQDAINELELYLEATRWHSDALPWRIPLAKKRIAKLRNGATQSSGAAPAPRRRARPSRLEQR